VWQPCELLYTCYLLVTFGSLRSADVSTCVVPPTLSYYGDRTLAATRPRLWNFLPVQLSNPDITYGLFRRQLKGHFLEAHTRRSVTSDRWRNRKHLLTYITLSGHIVLYIFVRTATAVMTHMTPTDTLTALSRTILFLQQLLCDTTTRNALRAKKADEKQAESAAEATDTK